MSDQVYYGVADCFLLDNTLYKSSFLSIRHKRIVYWENESKK